MTGASIQKNLVGICVAGMSAAVFATLAACSALLQEPPGVSYARSVEQLGIYPVYPPREDLQVGDIYGIEVKAGVENVKLHTVFVDSVDLTKAIRGYLAHRYQFGNTSAETASQSINGISAPLPSQTDAPASNGHVLDTSDLKNLPITGFPAIEVDSGLAIGVTGASQSLAAIFGFEAAKTLKMTLHYGSVTSYSVPIPLALQALQGYCAQQRTRPAPQNCDSQTLAYYMDEKYQLGTGAKGIKTAVPLMVSKVYLARAISYTFNDRTLAAAAASIASGQDKKAPSLPTVDGGLLDAAVKADSPEMVTALAAFQNALNGSTASQQGTEGVSVTLSGYTQNTVTFQEVYQRPVVIGYEGVYVPG